MGIQIKQYLTDMQNMFNTIMQKYEETGVLDTTETLFLEIYKRTIGV
jgi:hypothetical protein